MGTISPHIAITWQPRSVYEPGKRGVPPARPSTTISSDTCKPMPQPLSPAAQAVLDACDQAFDQCGATAQGLAAARTALSAPKRVEGVEELALELGGMAEAAADGGRYGDAHFLSRAAELLAQRHPAPVPVVVPVAVEARAALAEDTGDNGYEAICHQLIKDLAAARDALEAWTEYLAEDSQPTAKAFCMMEYESARDSHTKACNDVAILKASARAALAQPAPLAEDDLLGQEDAKKEVPFPEPSIQERVISVIEQFTDGEFDQEYAADLVFGLIYKWLDKVYEDEGFGSHDSGECNARWYLADAFQPFVRPGVINPPLPKEKDA